MADCVEVVVVHQQLNKVENQRGIGRLFSGPARAPETSLVDVYRFHAHLLGIGFHYLESRLYNLAVQCDIRPQTEWTWSPTTPERIADVARRRFNRKGYASTTLTEIADEVGISQGNLTYHFPTKLDLALHLSEQVRVSTEGHRSDRREGDLADDYVEQLRFVMETTWRYLFLIRDRGIFDDANAVVPPSPILVAALEERRQMIRRIEHEGLFRADAEIDVEKLACSLWILSRYWVEYLREMEERDEIEWAEVERGIEHHFAVLLPLMTAVGRRRFRAALNRHGSE